MKQKKTLTAAGAPQGRPRKYSEPTTVVNFRLTVSRKEALFALTKAYGFDYAVDYLSVLIDRAVRAAEKKGSKVGQK